MSIAPTTQIRAQTPTLAALRKAIPRHPIYFKEALRLAEWQAGRLRELYGIDTYDMPASVVYAMPRIRVVQCRLPVDGMTHWDSRNWIIRINILHSPVKQRYTLFHELKHIIDHGHTAVLYTGSRTRSPSEQAERACEYFAASALIPKERVKEAWDIGLRGTWRFARLFDVSTSAMAISLEQLGLRDDYSPSHTETKSERRTIL